MSKQWVVLRTKNGEPRGYWKDIKASNNPPLNRLITVDDTTAFDIMDSENALDVLKLWKLLRYKEIYRIMKEEMTDHNVYWGPSKLKLIRKWLKYGDPLRISNNMYWSRFVMFNSRDLVSYA